MSKILKRRNKRLKKDLTLSSARDTDFPRLYRKFILDEEMHLKDKEKILAITTISIFRLKREKTFRLDAFCSIIYNC